MKRLSSVTLSPIYAHFTASLEGAPVIRAMADSPRFIRANADHVEANARAQYAQLIVSQWLNFNLQAMGVIVILGASLAAILERRFFKGGESFGRYFFVWYVNYASVALPTLFGMTAEFYGNRTLCLMFF